jgi:hypothetical protein
MQFAKYTVQLVIAMKQSVKLQKNNYSKMVAGFQKGKKLGLTIEEQDIQNYC